jgi:hypothetical protein
VAPDHVHEREIKQETLDRLNVPKRGRRSKSIDVALTRDDYEPSFIIDCPQCNKDLKDDPRFAANPNKIPLTPDQITERERNEKEGNNLTRLMAQAMATAAAEAINKQRLGL